MTGIKPLRAFTALALAAGILATSAAAARADGPAAPTGVRVTGTTASTATLAWNASAGAAQYRVLEYEWNGSAYEGALRTTVTGTSATVENLMPNRNYMFLVRAVDGSGSASGDSEIVHAETPPDTTGPTVPGNARATDVSFTTAKLQWESSTDDHFLMGYWLSVDGSTPKFTTSDLSTSVRRLAPGRPHTVAISARDSMGNFSQSATVGFTTLVDDEAPTAPTNLRGNGGGFTWTASQDNSGETNYVLFVDGSQTSTESGFDTTSIFFDGCFTFFPAPPGTHTATVRARDRAGNLSAPSNEVTVTVP